MVFFKLQLKLPKIFTFLTWASKSSAVSHCKKLRGNHIAIQQPAFCIEGDQTHKKKYRKVIFFHLIFFLKECDQIVSCMASCVKKGYEAGDFSCSIEYLFSKVSQNSQKISLHEVHWAKLPVSSLQHEHLWNLTPYSFMKRNIWIDDV